MNNKIAEQSSLINGVRFDLGAKLIYAYYRIRNFNTSWHIELYINHILTFNGGWEWPGGVKDDIKDFLICFDNLIDNFDPEKAGTLPTSQCGVLANGAHRCAVAFLKGHNLKVEVKEKNRRQYDYRFFENRRRFLYPKNTPQKNLKMSLPFLDPVYMDEMALEFCRRCPNLRIVTLLPKAFCRTKEVEELLRSTGEVIYYTSFSIPLEGLDYVVKEFYRGEPWVSSDPEDRFFAPSTMVKTKQCWNPTNSFLRVFLFEPKTPITQVKDRIRKLYDVGKSSVHINDTFEETQRLGGLFFNVNSRDYICLQASSQAVKHTLSRNNKKMFKRYFDATKELKGDYCITGSFVMALYGIRDAGDLDYISHGTPFDDHSHNSYASLYDKTLDDIIYNPRNHFYFAGRKVATLEVVRAMKRKRNEPKDVLDVRLIDLFLGKNVINRAEILPVPGKSFDIHQITFFKNGLRLENFFDCNKKLGGVVNFFEASDTTTGLCKSIKEGLETKTYDPRIRRFANAIKKCPGKIGCNLSHYYLYLHLLDKSPCKWHLILEDDVCISNSEGLLESIEKLICQVESHYETHYIKLITFEEFVKRQFIPVHRIQEVDNLYHKIPDWGTGAQLISNTGLQILLDNRPWDYIDCTVILNHKQLNCTCFQNNFFENRGTESGIAFDSNKKYFGSLIYNQKTCSENRCIIGYPSIRPDTLVHIHGWTVPTFAKAVLEPLNIKCIIELGSWHGKSALHFAEYLEKIYCVDSWKSNDVYKTFIVNTWHFRSKIIPVRADTLKGIEMIKLLPFKPEAAYVDAEHSYDSVSNELNKLFNTFGRIVIFGNGDSPKAIQAAEEFADTHKMYQYSTVDSYFLLKPKPLVTRCVAFWNGFNPEKSYLRRILPDIKFTSDLKQKVDFIYKSDYGPQVKSEAPIVAYSAEAWFKPPETYAFSITLQESQEDNIQFRNYERIYFERFGKTDVYSNIPAIRAEKKEFCSFVVQNPNCWQRNTFFEMLNLEKGVASLGSYRHNVSFTIPKRDPYTESHDRYLQILGGYRFCICFENTSQEGYLTEKLYNAMKSGTVPIYWGDKKAIEIFNPKSFIYIPTSEHQVQEFQKAIAKILYLEENPEEYELMLKQPRVLNVGRENYRVGQSLKEIKSRLLTLV